jgi:hypothetical protein
VFAVARSDRLAVFSVQFAPRIRTLAMAAAAPLPQPASIDEKLASFDSVPLFMKSLPQDETDNDLLGALQSLAFDGTPDGG